MMVKNKLKGKNFSPISPKEQEWIGEIITKKRKKVYKENEFQGNIIYKLKVVAEKEEKPRNLFVYPNLVSKEIFSTIEKGNYIFKKYLFFCERMKWGWILHNWQELPINSHLSKNKEPILRNYA